MRVAAPTTTELVGAGTLGVGLAFLPSTLAPGTCEAQGCGGSRMVVVEPGATSSPPPSTPAPPLPQLPGFTATPSKPLIVVTPADSALNTPTVVSTPNTPQQPLVIVTTPTAPNGPVVMNSDSTKSSVPPSILGNDGKLPPGKNGVGTPITMPASPDPSAAAEEFAKAAFNGQTPVKIINNITGQGSWVAIMPDGTAITYRPAGQASKTEKAAATVEVNNPAIKTINNGKNAKFKFPSG